VTYSIDTEVNRTVQLRNLSLMTNADKQADHRSQDAYRTCAPNVLDDHDVYDPRHSYHAPGQPRPYYVQHKSIEHFSKLKTSER
jgi:hypothetical protein